VAVLCTAAKVSHIVPPPDQAPLRVEGDRISLQIGGVGVGIEHLEGAARLRYLREHKVTERDDPFASDPGGRYRFTTFRLDLINRSKEEVNLNPASLRVVVDAIPYFALEYTTYYEHFVSRRRLDPKIIDDLARGVYVEPVVLPPGGGISRLVAFQDLPQRFKSFQILCDSILVGTENKSFVVPFGVVQEKVKETGPKRERSEDRRGRVSIGAGMPVGSGDGGRPQ
jgi:hypothetical protein